MHIWVKYGNFYIEEVRPTSNTDRGPFQLLPLQLVGFVLPAKFIFSGVCADYFEIIRILILHVHKPFITRMSHMNTKQGHCITFAVTGKR